MQRLELMPAHHVTWDMAADFANRMTNMYNESFGSDSSLIFSL